jgi:hypothetical protein
VRERRFPLCQSRCRYSWKTQSRSPGITSNARVIWETDKAGLASVIKAGQSCCDHPIHF